MDLLEMQKYFILKHLKEGDTCADFTMGNGHDTAFLSSAVGESGHVTAFDIQPGALVSAEKTLKENNCPENYTLICASHDRCGEFIDTKIKAGMFNLGYLPGSGHKELTTMRKTTLPAVKKAIELLDRDAVLTVAVYPGHEEGKAEGEELSAYFETLSRFEYSITQIRVVNSPLSPFFFVIETPNK